MSVRKFVPENRLAKAIGDPNGLLIAHALQHAGANLAKARPAHVAALDRKLDALRSLATDEAGDAFYRTARDVYADAGALGLTHISRAALSLCDLLVSSAAPARRRAAISVHVEAIMAMRAVAEDQAATQREAILQGLFSISGKTP